MIGSKFFQAGALLCLIAFAGCGKSRPSAKHPLPASHLVSQSEPGQVGGRLMLGTATSPQTFNPLFALDTASDSIVRLLYGSLVQIDHFTQEPRPGLAQNWSVAENQKTWTFKLREGLRWNDGKPITAQDVVFTWNEIMYNPEFNHLTYDLFRIRGQPFLVTNLDNLTIQVTTPDIFAPFLEFFGGVPVLPKHALDPAVRSKHFPTAYGITTPPERIVGCGPFRVKEVQPRKFVLLEANPEFWVADKQGQRLPYFNQIMFDVGGGPGADTVMFLKGKSDACETVRLDNFQAFQQAAGKGGFKLVELGAGSERDFLWFNLNTGADPSGKPLVDPVKLKWFRNKKFRQAVSSAIDRDRLVREVYQGHALPIYGFLSAENPKWNNPNIPRYGFDPAKARALLAEIGIEDRNKDGQMKDSEGHPIEIVFHSNTGNALRQKAALLIQEDLRKIGIKLVYQPVDFKVLVQKINRTFDYECALMGLGGGGVDPASQLNVLKSSEELHQWFPFQQSPSTDWEARVDALMESQMRTLNFAERKKAFDEVQVILAEELPMIYTVAPFSYAAIRQNIGNVRPSVLTPYHVTWNIEELFFKN